MSRVFFVPADSTVADFGEPPEGARILVTRGEGAPFRDLGMTIGAIAEVQDRHLRWYRMQPDGDRARLDGARLDGASLDGARLDGASLDGARLDGARLDGASLDGARLDGARLDGARLVGASLVGASLDGASLVGASLVGARLDGASLVGASLVGARLDAIRADVRDVLDRSPAEVPGLLLAIREGRVDGSCYEGACACLVGTLANVRGVAHTEIPGLRPNASRPAEVWFMHLQPGMTPENNPVSAITAGWIAEWIAERTK